MVNIQVDLLKDLYLNIETALPDTLRSMKNISAAVNSVCLA